MKDLTKSQKLSAGWSVGVDKHLSLALGACDVRCEAIDADSLRLDAVPLSTHFSKIRTNLLVHRGPVRIHAYVDYDLAYDGPNMKLQAALAGNEIRRWRELSLDIDAGEVGQVVRATLAAIDSPVVDLLNDTEDFRSAMGVAPQIASNSRLATETHPVESEDLAAAFRVSVRKPLAHRVAEVFNRRPCCGCVVWAASGAGKSHFLYAVAHILLHSGFVDAVRRLPGERLARDHVFPAERDGELVRLLDEVATQPRMLLLVDRLELGLSCTTESLAMLSEAIDRGTCILASADDEKFLREVQKTPALATRLMPVNLPLLGTKLTLRALKGLVRASDVDVSPAAMLAAVELSQRRGNMQPGGAIRLLSAAISTAHWKTNKTITPDDVMSVLNPAWPE